MVKETAQKNPLGPTGSEVARNVRRLRGNMTYRELSDLLSELGRPIPVLGLSRIENGARRVDADDLMALAVAFGVNPAALLLPFSTRRDELYEITGASGLPPHQVWDWADGTAPLLDPDGDESDLKFQLRARPPGRRSMRNLPGRRLGDLSAERLNQLWPDGGPWTEETRVRQLDDLDDGLS